MLPERDGPYITDHQKLLKEYILHTYTPFPWFHSETAFVFLCSIPLTGIPEITIMSGDSSFTCRPAAGALQEIIFRKNLLPPCGHIRKVLIIADSQN